MIYTIHCCVAKVLDRHLYNVINKKIFVSLFIYHDFIWIKIQRIVRTIFNTNFFYTIHVTFNTIILMPFLSNLSYNSNNINNQQKWQLTVTRVWLPI